MRQIVLDTETTGLRPEDGHRVIEIGCIEMIDRKLTDNHFHYYINPQCEVEAGALAVHGISNEFLQDKPLFADIIDDFVNYIKGAELIIHNAPFDVGFLNHEFSLLKVKGHQPINEICSILDTLQLARKRHAGQRNSLDALCKRYSIDNSKRELHGALLDASILAQVYLAMTGGQSSLFADQESGADDGQSAVMSMRVKRIKEHSAVVLKADEQEMSEHDRYLSGIEDSLWQN